MHVSAYFVRPHFLQLEIYFCPVYTSAQHAHADLVTGLHGSNDIETIVQEVVARLCDILRIEFFCLVFIQDVYLNAFIIMYDAIIIHLQ